MKSSRERNRLLAFPSPRSRILQWHTFIRYSPTCTASWTEALGIVAVRFVAMHPPTKTKKKNIHNPSTDSFHIGANLSQFIIFKSSPIHHSATEPQRHCAPCELWSGLVHACFRLFGGSHSVSQCRKPDRVGAVAPWKFLRWGILNR